MADFNIDGRMKVKTLKAQFKEAFGATLRVYKGPGFADDNATLASIRRQRRRGESGRQHEGRQLRGQDQGSVRH